MNWVDVMQVVGLLALAIVEAVRANPKRLGALVAGAMAGTMEVERETQREGLREDLDGLRQDIRATVREELAREVECIRAGLRVELGAAVRLALDKPLRRLTKLESSVYRARQQQQERRGPRQ
jgi:hypothetical protein